MIAEIFRSRFAIVGGGVGGLTCAAFLRKAGFQNVTVFDKKQFHKYEKSDENGIFTARDTALGLWKPALSVLRQLDVELPESWLQNGSGAYVGPSGYRSVDGKWLANAPEDLLHSKQLLAFSKQSVLLEMLEKFARAEFEADGKTEFVYGKKLVQLSEDSASVKLTFEDIATGGTEDAEFDFVIGADGLNSFIRTQVSTLDPVTKYSVGNYVVYRGYAAGEEFPVSDESFQTWGHNHARFATVALNKSQVWYATVPRKVFDAEVHEMQRDNLNNILLDRFGFSKWHSPIPDLIERTDPEFISSTIANSLNPHVWRGFSTPRITLIGDACHGMDPLLAQGAGIAIEDALLVVHEIVQQIFHATAEGNGVQDLREAFQKYEDSRVPRLTNLLSISNLANMLGMMGPFGSTVRDSFMYAFPNSQKSEAMGRLIKISLSADSDAVNKLDDNSVIYDPPQLWR
jgi:2-polyprenyl-6-methoxyphenol hydroxylase-like FAD-dependent oxidoreductase